MTQDLTPDELIIALEALWTWREQIGRAGAELPAGGLGAAADVLDQIAEVARKLGGDPHAYKFGPPQGSF